MERNYNKEMELEAYATMLFTKHNLLKDWRFLVLDKYQRQYFGGNDGISTSGYCNLSMKSSFSGSSPVGVPN